ncbi:hypothetical protein [Lusitaniella coriacea]|uniref:hypothetical protein n=1 Tax=Lusitaniella coriacea TaxID=1983105 RepID=UPI003CECA277
MSELTKALDSILLWLQQHKPNYADKFLPGLSRMEIERQTIELLGKVPEEIYKLYQWRNGTSEEDIQSVVYPSLGYLPLHEAIQECKWMSELYIEDEVFSFEGKLLFPFLRNNCSFCAVLLDREKQRDSPVIDIADELDLLLLYKSLTSMMITLAEYCNSGAYYIGEVDEEMGGRKYEVKGFLSPDDAKIIPIFQKHNPGILLIQ